MTARTSIEASRSAALEVWGLFVDDGALAIVAVLAIFGVAIFALHYGDTHSVAGALLIVGVLLAVWAGLHDATKAGRSAAAAPPPPAELPPVASSAPQPVDERPLISPTGSR